MSNPNDVVLLFRRKAEQWERESSVQRHLTDLGIEGIARSSALSGASRRSASY